MSITRFKLKELECPHLQKLPHQPRKGLLQAQKLPFQTKKARRTAAIVLAATAAFMTTFIVIWCVNGPEKFLNYLGFSRSGEVLPHAWLLAAATAAGYIAYTARMIPEVQHNILCFKGLLKWLGIYAGFAGGIVEEALFRQMLMDWLQGNGACALLQIVLSALAFGLIHLSWSLLGGNLRTGTASAASTAALGLLLAVVYVAAGRNLLPAVAAHVLINLFVEPWLILSAVGASRHEPTRQPHETQPRRN